MLKKYLILFFFISNTVYAKAIFFGTTTTTVDSGLITAILPSFTKKTNIEVKVVTGPTGFILKQLERGDLRLVLTHQPNLEKVVQQKISATRIPFIYNYFILIGPKNDPAGISTSHTFSDALSTINHTRELFISRGDTSGSYYFEKNHWLSLNLNPDSFHENWYIQTGQGAGETLMMAAQMNAYTIVDNATWFNFKHKATLRKLFSDHQIKNRNQYALLFVENKLSKEESLLLNWLKDKKLKQLIRQFNQQEPLFYYDN